MRILPSIEALIYSILFISCMHAVQTTGPYSICSSDVRCEKQRQIAATTMHDMLDTVGNELPWRVSIEQSVFTVPVSEQQHCSGLHQFSCITWMASQWKNQCKFDLVCQQCEFLLFPPAFCTHI